MRCSWIWGLLFVGLTLFISLKVFNVDDKEYRDYEEVIGETRRNSAEFDIYKNRPTSNGLSNKRLPSNRTTSSDNVQTKGTSTPRHFATQRTLNVKTVKDNDNRLTETAKTKRKINKESHFIEQELEDDISSTSRKDFSGSGYSIDFEEKNPAFSRYEQIIHKQRDQRRFHQNSNSVFETKIPAPIDLAILHQSPKAVRATPKPSKALSQSSKPTRPTTLVPTKTVDKIPHGSLHPPHIHHVPTRPWMPTVPMKNAPIQSCKSDIDLAFLIEASKSISNTGYHNYEFLKNFVKDIALRLVISPDYVRVGLITFACQQYLHLGLYGGSSIKHILDALSIPAPVPHTSWEAKTGSALDFAHTSLYGCYCGPKSKRKKVVVVITDGRSVDDVYWPAKKMKDAGIQILSVGIGRYFDINQLNSMASSPVSKNVFTGSFGHIRHVVNAIVKQICEGRDKYRGSEEWD